MLYPDLTSHASTSFPSIESKTTIKAQKSSDNDEREESTRLYGNGLIKKSILFVCLLVLMLNGCEADTGLKNRVKAPDELFQVRIFKSQGKKFKNQ